MTTEQVLGVTPPISTSLPTEDEKRQNNALFDELRAQGSFEAPSDTAQREQALKLLQRMADEFVKRAAMEKEPKNTFLIKNARGRIFTYGSYRLGVHGPGSDMDTLVVAPKFVTVEQYFDIFPKLLEEMSPPGAVVDVNAIPDAFVPIITFELTGISIDLIFCPIATLKELPDDKDWTLADNNLLRGLTENQVRSLNGTRVNDEMLTLVPEVATFRLAVRAIKLWAQRKAIYGNILGFPGGIAWLIMVARVCQLYPKATAAVIVRKFFTIMLKWPWPFPVYLKEIEYGLSITRVAVWNPKIYPTDRNHRMPVITPSYPSMCSTHNVTQTAMTVIKRELDKAQTVAEEIMRDKRPWKDLFKKHTFFTDDFKYYIAVISCSRTKEAHNKWSTYIESKVRHLATKLDMHPDIVMARPFNKGIERLHHCHTDTQYGQIQSGSVAYVVDPKTIQPEAAEAVIKAEKSDEQKADVTEAATTDTKSSEANGVVKVEDSPEHKPPTETAPPAIEVYTANHYIGLELNEGVKALDLAKEVRDFRTMCQNWEKYDHHLNALTVNVIKNFDLPEDLFDASAGEVKPSKPIKKKRPADGSAPANGRDKGPVKKRKPATG